MKKTVLWAAISVAALALYPVVKSNGILDQWVGIWWLLAFPLIPLSAMLFARILAPISARRRSARHEPSIGHLPALR